MHVLTESNLHQRILKYVGSTVFSPSKSYINAPIEQIILA